MVLAQSRYWRASLSKGAGSIAVEILRDSLPEDMRELREFRIEVPLSKWNRVVKHVQTDRKLFGGVLLDFAKHKDQVSAAVASDRLFYELQRVVFESTVTLVESGCLALTAVDVGSG
jgi:hypothetical protein